MKAGPHWINSRAPRETCNRYCSLGDQLHLIPKHVFMYCMFCVVLCNLVSQLYMFLNLQRFTKKCWFLYYFKQFVTFGSQYILLLNFQLRRVSYDPQMNGHKLMEAEDLRKALLLNVATENERRSCSLRQPQQQQQLQRFAKENRQKRTKDETKISLQRAPQLHRSLVRQRLGLSFFVISATRTRIGNVYKERTPLYQGFKDNPTFYTLVNNFIQSTKDTSNRFCQELN